MDLINFQMIEKVIAVDKNLLTLHAMSQVPFASPILDAHFPSYPLLPGVFLLETMAQAAGYLSMWIKDYKQLSLLFAANELKIRGPALPGAVLDIQVHITHQGSGFVVADGKILLQDKCIASSELRLRLIDFPSQETQARVREQGLKIGLA